MDATEASHWREAGWRDEDAVLRAVMVGMDAYEALLWRFAFTVPHDVRRPTCDEVLIWWLAAKDEVGLFAPEVAAWAEVGVYRPEDRPVGLSVDDVLCLAEAGVQTHRPEWAGAQGLCPRMVRRGVEVGADPETVVAMFTTAARSLTVRWDCRHPRVHCEWESEQVAEALREVEALPGHLWADAVVCLRAGMALGEAVAHVRAGGPMVPIRVMAALAP